MYIPTSGTLLLALHETPVDVPATGIVARTIRALDSVSTRGTGRPGPRARALRPTRRLAHA